MRRDILLPLLGFLGGFVAAAMVFWQPVSTSNATPQSATAEAAAAKSAPARDSAPVAATDHRGRRLVVSARENEGVAPVADSVPQPMGAAEIFHEAIGTLKDMDPQRRQAAINSLVKQLRAAGPEGFQVLRDYFRAGQDVKFQNGYAVVDGRVVQTPSLRSALLATLGDWPGGEALDLTREILRTTSRMSEASLAIGQLEKKSPGTYRAEAIQALQQLAAKPAERDGWAMSNAQVLYDAMRQFKAAELLPSAEALAVKNPWSAQQYIAALDSLPADVRSSALQRLFANEAVTKNMASNAWSMQGLNYSEPVVAQNVAQIFVSSTDKKFRENFLTSFANTQTWSYAGYSGGGGGVSVQGTTASTTADRVGRLQGKLALLDTIAPQCNTPVLQERLQDAREAIQKAITNPDAGKSANIYGGGTIQLGGAGGAVIQADSIQVIPGSPSK